MSLRMIIQKHQYCCLLKDHVCGKITFGFIQIANKFLVLSKNLLIDLFFS